MHLETRYWLPKRTWPHIIQAVWRVRSSLIPLLGEISFSIHPLFHSQKFQGPVWPTKTRPCAGSPPSLQVSTQRQRKENMSTTFSTGFFFLLYPSPKNCSLKFSTNFCILCRSVPLIRICLVFVCANQDKNQALTAEIVKPYSIYLQNWVIDYPPLM